VVRPWKESWGRWEGAFESGNRQKVQRDHWVDSPHISFKLNIEIFPSLSSSLQIPLYRIDDFPISEFRCFLFHTRSIKHLSYTFDDISFSRGGGGGVGILSEFSFILTNV
jgi:hypothetical protein